MTTFDWYTTGIQRTSIHILTFFAMCCPPFFLKAKSGASKEDNPNWHQAMH